MQRAYQHKHKMIEGFSKKYNIHLLVYYELHDTMQAAIARENRLKNGSVNGNRID